jgi:tetratricopeptide (TPR) repeat protein
MNTDTIYGVKRLSTIHEEDQPSKKRKVEQNVFSIQDFYVSEGSHENQYLDVVTICLNKLNNLSLQVDISAGVFFKSVKIWCDHSARFHNPQKAACIQKICHYILDKGFKKNIIGLEDLNTVLQNEPADVLALNSRGDVYRQLGQLAMALADFNAVLKVQPNEVFALSRRGEVHRLQGNLDEALVDFTKALQIHPNNVFALSRRGEVHRLQGDLDEALWDFEIALKFEPENEIALVGKEGVQKLQGGLDEGDWFFSLES